MEKIIFKISCVTYFISVIAMIYLVLNPNMDISPEIISYMQWWYSQPNTALEDFVSKVTLVALVISLAGVTALFFNQKWGGYLFIPSILFLITTEWLTSDYAPRTSLESNIDTIASMSIGFILCFFIFSKKLGTFKHNKSFKPTPKIGAV